MNTYIVNISNAFQAASSLMVFLVQDFFKITNEFV